MTPDTPEPAAILSRWREAEQAATAEPWEVHRSSAAGIRLASDEADWPLAEGFRRAADAEFAAVARTAMPLLLAAVEAVLKRHARRDKPVRTHHICSAHGPFGDDEGYTEGCPDCFITEKHVCATCRHTCPDDDEWPCAEYLAIRAALAGEEGP